ncbi:hypothetical protein PBI_JOHANN_35 [Microbacterium phage Johann]|uniref:Uncharacterized protein n=2 Tax=Goodmanvirus goodman TaxID=2734238 RepID=A0A3G3LZN8_9CAUD|nr:hypothetical protein HOU56_gp35 [Microbacterium phage Goodman]AYQ99491.1 hypothetical protein PBI_GOODMAN_35 [Microbacterium phage Goodman]AYQ99659.1 hypothetical protein PBI_JOHANN_35 [Microbacterium phage Johann]
MLDRASRLWLNSLMDIEQDELGPWATALTTVIDTLDMDYYPSDLTVSFVIDRTAAELGIILNPDLIADQEILAEQIIAYYTDDK